MEKKRIKEIAGAWQEAKRPYVKESTHAAYLLIVENHILPYFGHSYGISEQDVQNFVLYKISSGMSVKSVKDILIVLKMIVRFGSKYHWIDFNDWELKFPADSATSSIDILSVSHHRKILDYVKTHFTFPDFGIYISLSTGMRIGEVCALQWRDIDVASGTITVHQTLSRIYCIESGVRHTKVVIGSPKTRNSLREIPMSRELLAIVRPLVKIVNPDYFVITNDCKPTEPRTYRNHYRRFMKHLGLPQIKFHSLRHSFATRCIESNCDYKTVSVLLGHANISTTLNLYVHPNMEQKKRCIAKMTKALGR